MLSAEKTVQAAAAAGGSISHSGLEEVCPHPLHLQMELSRGVLGQEGVFWVRDNHGCPWLYLWVSCNSGSSNSGMWSCPPSRLAVGTTQHERDGAHIPDLPLGCPTH